MACDPIIVDGKQVGHACTRGSSKTCQECKSRKATLLCDYPLSGEKKGKTCDRSMCRQRATSIGPELDYCPAHTRHAQLKSENK